MGDALAADTLADDPGIEALARAVPTEVVDAHAKVSALAIQEANDGLYARLRQRRVEVLPTPADRLTVGVLQTWLDLKARRAV